MRDRYWGQYTSERRALKEARQRCGNQRNKDWGAYGGRGIRVCKAWLDPDHCFVRFIEHIGPKPSKSHSLERIDNARGYEPGNVRWADRIEQANNRRSSRHILDVEGGGVLRTYAEFARVHDVSIHLVRKMGAEQRLANEVEHRRPECIRGEISDAFEAAIKARLPKCVPSESVQFEALEDADGGRWFWSVYVKPFQLPRGLVECTSVGIVLSDIQEWRDVPGKIEGFIKEAADETWQQVKRAIQEAA